MPASTDQHTQDQRSDAERADAAYYHSKILQTALGMFIHDGGTTPLEKACARSLKLRLNDKVTEFGGSTWRGDIFASVNADRDRQFVEEVEVLIRQHVACASHECSGTRPLLATLCQFVRNRYVPCTAKEKG